MGGIREPLILCGLSRSFGGFLSKNLSPVLAKLHLNADFVRDQLPVDLEGVHPVGFAWHQFFDFFLERLPGYQLAVGCFLWIFFQFLLPVHLLVWSSPQLRWFS